MVPASSRTQPPHRRRRSTGAVGVLRILVARCSIHPSRPGPSNRSRSSHSPSWPRSPLACCTIRSRHVCAWSTSRSVTRGSLRPSRRRCLDWPGGSSRPGGWASSGRASGRGGEGGQATQTRCALAPATNQYLARGDGRRVTHGRFDRVRSGGSGTRLSGRVARVPSARGSTRRLPRRLVGALGELPRGVRGRGGADHAGLASAQIIARRPRCHAPPADRGTGLGGANSRTFGLPPASASLSR